MSQRKTTTFTPGRIIGFLVTGAVLLGVLQLVPVDPDRAAELTANKLLNDGFFDPLVPEGPGGDSADEASEDQLPIAQLTFAEGSVSAANETIESAFSKLFEPSGDGPVVLVDATLRGDHLVLTASIDGGEETATGQARIGDWRSLVPPLLAILIALFFHRVLLGMVSAVLVGGVLHFTGGPFGRLWSGIDDYYVGNILSEFNLYIVGFTCALVGMVIVATRSGGSQGLIDLVTRVADSAKSTRIATALMGLVVFFDDYANTIVVGTTVRPMSDRRRISREKLAYLVDSTAAPIAGLAVISTWIAYEVGILQTLIDQIGLQLEPGAMTNGYAMFVAMIPLRFYCLFCLLFVFTGAITGRDYGPMLKAERRAALTGEVLGPNARPLTSRTISDILPEPGIRYRWYNAVAPVVVVIGAVLFGMLYSGRGEVAAAGLEFNVLSFETWKYAFGGADSGKVLFIAAMLGSAVAIALPIGQRVLTARTAVLTWARGFPAMWLAISILVSAWAIQSVCRDLGTNVYLVSAIGESIPALVFPLFVFLVAAAVAFATGTSWGTMGILLPVILPWAFELAGGDGASMLIVLLSAAAVLDGAIMGDHCSPISDTTVMSSMASSCDHLDHVRTQLPYALTVMVIASLAYLGAAAGGSWGLLILGGLVLIVTIFFVVGRRVPLPPEDSEEQTAIP